MGFDDSLPEKTILVAIEHASRAVEELGRRGWRDWRWAARGHEIYFRGRRSGSLNNHRAMIRVGLVASFSPGDLANLVEAAWYSDLNPDNDHVPPGGCR